MPKPSSILSNRYAEALFSIASDKKKLDDVQKDLSSLLSALQQDSSALKIIANPLIKTQDLKNFIAALAKKLKLDELVEKFVFVLIENKRLALIEGVITAYKSKLAAHNGELEAEVVSTSPLKDKQIKEIQKVLKQHFNKEVKVTTTINQAILGGLVVKLGSQMLDNSLASKLSNLHISSTKAIKNI